jgi:hypothetical protein
MKPKPLESLNHLTVPVVVSDMIFSYLNKVLIPSREGGSAESSAVTYENQVGVLLEELRLGAINTRLNLQARRTI